MAASPFASRSPSVTVASPNTAIRLKAAAAQAGSESTDIKTSSQSHGELTEQLNNSVAQNYERGSNYLHRPSPTIMDLILMCAISISIQARN